MNRLIKFRAWNKEESRMIDLNGFEIAFKGMQNEGGVTAAIEQGNLYMHDIGDVYIMQFTNQTDINNKDIFEQDIVKLTFENAAWDEPVVYREVVRFHNGMWMAGDKPLYRDEYAPYAVEVIGNIFENAELLEGKAK
ncbi:putative YopX-like protein [Vibrio phage 381E49-1]|nr:putative YopX-like protein [Vibrio phage 381E49-1]